MVVFGANDLRVFGKLIRMRFRIIPVLCMFWIPFTPSMHSDDASTGGSSSEDEVIFGTKHREARLTFETIVENAFGKRVISWDGSHRDELENSIRIGVDQFNRSGSSADRMNEVGTLLEDCLRGAMTESGLAVGIPKTRSGRVQRSGYPDLRLELDKRVYYIEVKTFSTSSIGSSQRTFYVSNSVDPKVTEDAVHLLIGFEVDKKSDDSYRVIRFLCRDIRKLACKVKIEFNASNLDMYQDLREGEWFEDTVE